MQQYDLCVIGSGPAGQHAAIQSAKLGKKVCVVEKRRAVGGVAVNTGTIPSKALREAILSVGGRSIACPTEADFAQVREALFGGLRRSCSRVIGNEIDVIEGHFARNGVEVIHGSARFADPHTIEITSETDTIRIKADHTLIAVGTVPAKPRGCDFDGETILSSDDIPNMKAAPHSMIVVGGGVIGSEFATMLQILGVKVTLIEGRAKLLEFVDAEIIEAFQFHIRQAGMTLRLGEKVTKISVIEAPHGARTVDNIMAEAELESGKTLRADSLLYCIGRQGATESLDLAKADLEADNRGRISVNEHFQTTVPHIYAAGDVIGFPALASTSYEQGRLAACHMFGESCESFSQLLPYGIYTIPEISMVGWTEQRLTEEGIPYECGIANYREIARGHLLGSEFGMLKLLIHQESHAILGVHAIGTGATELIHIGQTAIAFNATVEYFVNTVFNYPTLAECYKVAARNGLNKLRGI
ncbi:MAG TPA: Si-specific NAD(P)(+) transhydrogenase [Phycisphaerales bacterium]|nr:Si-specific NAD(P)(+) transhydrogenase [Phycisphaerales bacterium]